MTLQSSFSLDVLIPLEELVSTFLAELQRLESVLSIISEQWLLRCARSAAKKGEKNALKYGHMITRPNGQAS